MQLDDSATFKVIARLAMSFIRRERGPRTHGMTMVTFATFMRVKAITVVITNRNA